MMKFVDLEAARAAKDAIRIVVAGTVPSPWSEATKGLFKLAEIPVLAVRALPRNPELAAWTGVDNVPVVLYGHEPARSSWAAIVGLVARLAPGVLLPRDPAARADAIGTLELIAGEDGLGWNARLAMVHAGLASDGARGFAPPVAGYLARRYGYRAEDAEQLSARVAAQLAHLAARLERQRALGHEYLGGAGPSALDVYAATFLTPFVPLTDEECPNLKAPVRQAFGAAAEDLGALVAPALLALRRRMLERHLGHPIAL